MANVRDSDTCLWLHNKLGISNDSWTGGSICSQLNAEVLRNIKDCFPDLQTQVKLKLLLSFFHIPRRNVEEWKLELEEIIEVAALDSELWVAMLAETMKTFPATGSLNTEISDLDDVRPIFTDLVSDLRKLVKRQSETGMLPMECHYLNKAALVSVVGQQPTPSKHFTQKKKPKSALLRAELLQKSHDAQSNLKKASAPVIPVRSRGMPRKMTDTTPLKGIPFRAPLSGFRGALGPGGGAAGAGAGVVGGRPLPRTPAGRKDGGIKLLDIADQPLGAAAKKRKRLQELEDAKKTSEQANQNQHNTPVTTPEYAAPLSNTNNYTVTTTVNNTSTTSTIPSKETASVQQITTTVTTSTTNISYTPTSTVLKLPVNSPILVQTDSTDIATSNNTVPNLVVSNSNLTTVVATNLLTTTLSTANTLTPAIITTCMPTVLSTAAKLVTTVPKGTVINVASSKMNAVPASSLMTSGVTVTNLTTQQLPVAPGGVASVVVTRPIQQITQIRLQPTPVGGSLQKKGLALTREQMLEAQDMFRTANKVTRPEKALILGFMAGSRDNPCPHLGNIVTIKLSEEQENVLQPDDTYLTMMVETHFQMNYNNGEWKRIKKFRHLDISHATAATNPLPALQQTTSEGQPTAGSIL